MTRAAFWKPYWFLGDMKKRLLWHYNYFFLQEPKLKMGARLGVPIQSEEIIEELNRNDFNVVNYHINTDDYTRYVKSVRYDRFPDYYLGGKSGNFPEKSLEHYLALKLLSLSKHDVYIDIANRDSPAPQIYRELCGCTTYKQDLEFPEGIHGNVIGGDAGNMPIEDAFATKMALHCSFEHFEQDADIRFIMEAGRVLRVGGQLCILPLYLCNKYVILTDPTVLPIGGMSFESDAVLYCRRGWGNRHGRFYDVPHLISRIRDNMSELDLTIYAVQNREEVDPSCYVRFIALFTRT